jgi:hypothetical protein
MEKNVHKKIKVLSNHYTAGQEITVTTVAQKQLHPYSYIQTKHPTKEL